MRIKREARILVSKCYCSKCIGVVLRGLDVDGAASGEGCPGLCGSLESRGYSGELQYAVGDCGCGYPSPPESRPELEALALVLSSRLPLWLTRTLRLLGRGDCV